MSNKTKSPTFCIATLGCKVNKTDSARIEQILTDEGYVYVPFNQGADVYIINTCTVTGKSDYQSRQLVRRALRHNNKAKVVVTGCYAQTNPNAIKELPGVSLILRNTEKDKIGEYLRLKGRCTEHKTISCQPSRTNVDSSYTRSFLKIQDGCDWACTYCIVPRARGKSRSQPVDEVISEVKNSVSLGYKEIVLTGIHIGRFGLDLAPKANLAGLLSEIISLEGLGRLRITSLEPTEFTQDMIDVISGTDKICHHFHIPLQSADNTILRAMGRNYRFEQYQELILKLRESFPEASIGSDVIVGFPGEDADSFQTTYKRISQLPITYLHVFSYSKRPDTKAALLPNQVKEEDKKERSAILRNLGAQKKQAFYKSQTNKIRPCLILNQPGKSSNGHLTGLTDNYINVEVEIGREMINHLVDLKITSVIDDQIFGKISGDR